MADSTSNRISADQAVLGYVLRERIGSGGYGEVWSVEAPGGMMKAAKFIYGYHDDSRAQRELKAIDRIKHIRHPFLLSLERIDIVEGRMVVITELADMCLKARFVACQAAGLDAIPRSELLQYVREAAEALDYISEEHSLAHLDIKPENLLIVGSHVKVADFGLVKDLHSVNQSLLEGLTPAYAAPELFDGRPHKTSDQYSLAIVYQELLTGTRPFSGTTAAQLANQHLHSWPNLNSLPRGDQAVIARTLSKDPEKRFPTCRDLIEELGKRRNRVRGRVSEGPAPLPMDANTAAITNFDAVLDAKYINQTGTLSESFIPAMTCDGPIESLEPMAFDESESSVRPTLFLGVGKTGIQVLQQLKRRLVNRYGSMDRIPSFRFLCIDVDRKSLMEMGSGMDASALRTSEMITIPLRRPEEYRSDPHLDLGWIGRRWIYNVPKSQLTESLRPLGRLAFVDHHDAIYRRAIAELGHLIREEHLATTAETMELLPSKQPPQVIVVASVAGGTGSGLTLDLAYSLRIAMSELGLASDKVYGVFIHSTSRKRADHRLAVANSCAFLKELNHYNLNGYPGSSSCRIPEFTNETPVFDGAYFLHLGDEMQDANFEASIAGVAQYLFLSTATRCNSFFEQSRQSSEQDMQSLRTMGIGCLGPNNSLLSARTASSLTNCLFQKWLEPAESNDTSEHSALFVQHLLAVNELDEWSLNARIREMMTEAIGGEPSKKIFEIVETNKRRTAGDAQSTLTIIEVVLAQLLAGNRVTNESSVPGRQTVVVEFVDERIPAITRKCRDEFTKAILALIDDPGFRMGGAKKAATELIAQLQQTAIATETKHHFLEQNIANCRDRFQSLGQDKKAVAAKEMVTTLTVEMIELRLETFICDAQRKMVQLVLKEATAILESVEQIRKQFDALWERPNRKSPESTPRELDGTESRLFEMFDHQTQLTSAKNLDELETFLDEQILKPEGGLLAIIKDGARHLRSLAAGIHELANILVNRELQLLDIDSVIKSANNQVDRLSDWIDSVARDASPALSTCGGSRRLVIAVPQRAPIPLIAGILQQKMEQAANVIPSTCGELIVCTEMENLPIEHVAAKILLTQPDCAELIGRIRSRTDVDWSSVIPLC